MKLYRYLLFLFFAAVSLAFYSCASNSYQPKSIDSESKFPDVIEKANKDKRYFIMESGINIYNITSVDLDRGKKQMTVTLDKVDSSHLMYVKNPEIRRSKGRAGEKPTASEIHVYMKDSTSYTLDEPHTIGLEKVGRVVLFD